MQKIVTKKKFKKKNSAASIRQPRN